MTLAGPKVPQKSGKFWVPGPIEGGWSLLNLKVVPFGSSPGFLTCAICGMIGFVTELY